MAEETIITNVGEDDKSSVASEATMLELLAAVERMAKAAGMNPASARARTEKQINEALKANIKVSKKHTEAIEDNTDAFKDATRATSRFSNSLKGLVATILSSTITGLSGFANELINGGYELSNFARHVPIIGSLIAPLASIIDNTIDSFRSLSSVGAAFGNSLEELRSSAAAAHLPLDEFTQLIQSNSERMIFLGSTVSDGARRFAQIAGELREDRLYGSLKAMGFTTEEVNEGLANYINLQGRLGRLQGRTSAELAAGAAEYLHQIDRLAKATGRQRQEIERELEAINIDAAMLALDNQIRDLFDDDSDEYRAFVDARSRLAAMPQEMREAAVSAMMGIPNETAAVIGSEFIHAWRGLATGAFPEPREAYEMMASGFGNLREAFSDPTVIRALQQGIYSDAMSVLSRSREILEILGADIDQIEEEQDQRDGIIENLTQFDSTIRTIRATIESALIESGIFNLVARSLSDLAGYITGPEGLEAIRNSIQSMVDYFQGFITTVGDEGWQSALTSVGKDLLNVTIGIISEWWSEQSLFTRTMVIGAAALFALNGPISLALTAGITRLFTRARLPRVPGSGTAGWFQNAARTVTNTLMRAAPTILSRAALPLAIAVPDRLADGTLTDRAVRSLEDQGITIDNTPLEQYQQLLEDEIRTIGEAFAEAAEDAVAIADAARTQADDERLAQLREQRRIQEAIRSGEEFQTRHPGLFNLEAYVDQFERQQRINDQIFGAIAQPLDSQTDNRLSTVIAENIQRQGIIDLPDLSRFVEQHQSGQLELEDSMQEIRSYLESLNNVATDQAEAGRSLITIMSNVVNRLNDLIADGNRIEELLERIEDNTDGDGITVFNRSGR